MQAKESVTKSTSSFEGGYRVGMGKESRKSHTDS